MSYKPRSNRARWARDQIIAALRIHGVLNMTELAASIGCSEFVLRPVLAPMRRVHEIESIRLGFADVAYQLGVGAPAAVDVERFEPFPMSDT